MSICSTTKRSTWIRNVISNINKIYDTVQRKFSLYAHAYRYFFGQWFYGYSKAWFAPDAFIVSSREVMTSRY